MNAPQHRKRAPGGKRPLPGVQQIIAVASGKGGVGKSTVAMNLALALAERGSQVGLMDCDFYGPSLPTMVGIHERAQADKENRLLPHKVYKLKLMSLGFHVPRGDSVLWRGPMVTNTFLQLFYATHWQKLDYLVLDLPPGTGDIQQTLADTVPVAGALLVTTPQEVALRDVEKGLNMFRQNNVPVLGLVENMSYYLCENCEKKHNLFGAQGGKRMAEDNNLDLLGEIPLEARIPSELGLGEPLMIREPKTPAADAFRALATRISEKLSEMGDAFTDRGNWARSGPNAMEV